jgi:hypothetical protein
MNEIFLIERVLMISQNEHSFIEISHISSSLELAQKWIKENCDNYEKELESSSPEWCFFVYNVGIDEDLDEDLEKMYLFDWFGVMSKES